MADKPNAYNSGPSVGRDADDIPRFAKQGNVSASQVAKHYPANIEVGNKGLSASANGLIEEYTRDDKGKTVGGAERYDCELAEKIRGAVATSLKDGKLSPQEAKGLSDLVSNAPSAKGKDKKCSRADDL